MWKLLRDRRLANLKFRRQHAFGRFVVDFYCPSAQLVDGSVHDTKLLHDIERQWILERMGLRIFRFSNDEVLKRPDSVLNRIIEAANVSS